MNLMGYGRANPLTVQQQPDTQVYLHHVVYK